MSFDNDYDKIETQFQRDSNKVFKNNTDNYTDNDKQFLRQMNQLYGNALSAKGLNLMDPIYANMFHYNKMGMRGNVDYPRVSRTLVFFTRPELNFSFENINSIPFFKWLYSKRIGKMIMASLTDPEYFIYGPSALNSLSTADLATIETIMREYNDVMLNSERDILSNDQAFGDDYVAKPVDYNEPVASINEKDDAAAVAELDSMDFNILQSDTESLEVLNNQLNYVKSKYENLVGNDDKLEQLHWKLNTLIGANPNDPYGDNGKTKFLQDLGLQQAKSLLIENHNTPGDKFRFTTPFIPLLQNTCTQLTGARDYNLETHQYEEDEFSRSQTVPTGMDGIWGPGSFSTSFDDIAYGPVSLMMMVWVLYIHYVSRGYITTTREHITERILDYTCSAYVFVLGEDGKRIERWAKYTGAYPTSFPLSGQLDHNSTVDPEMLQKIQIQWNFNHYDPMNPEIFMDFNFLSETEWLVKLKDPLWDSLYNRGAKVDDDNFLEIHGDKSETEKQLLRALKRPDSLWDPVTAEKRGMSGALPTTLIEGTTTGFINNYWGGYPYINRGYELIWILPEYSISTGVTKDEFSGGSHINPKNVPNKSDASLEKTGYDMSPNIIQTGGKNIVTAIQDGVTSSTGYAWQKKIMSGDSSSNNDTKTTGTVTTTSYAVKRGVISDLETNTDIM